MSHFPENNPRRWKKELTELGKLSPRPQLLPDNTLIGTRTTGGHTRYYRFYG